MVGTHGANIFHWCRKSDLGTNSLGVSYVSCSQHSLKFRLTLSLCFCFRQESHFLQQPQCFQTRVVLRLDLGTSKMSLNEMSSRFFSNVFVLFRATTLTFKGCVANAHFNICFTQRENVEGVSQPPSDDVIRELSRSLREALGVSLFGIDVIINNQTGQHAVIDINAFPGRHSLNLTDTHTRKSSSLKYLLIKWKINLRFYWEL